MRETYPGLVLDLSSLDLEEIANALADQTDHAAAHGQTPRQKFFARLISQIDDTQAS